jgi:DnaJ-domain-containing protein 1
VGVIVLALAGIALWALIRMGRQTETPGRGHWRVSATILAAVLLGGAAVAGSRGAWVTAGALAVAGLWLTIASRRRDFAPCQTGMNAAEARALLGVSADATPDQINAAWRRLMARAHPDQGGTEGLAAKLNAARDRLLKR